MKLVKFLIVLVSFSLNACVTQTKEVPVKIIAFNDFHGNLEAPADFRASADAGESATHASIPAGGVEWMAGYVASLKAHNPNNVVVSAGDMIGASPLISALFHDEPTIEAMNRLGLDFNAVGNHEFDDGREELMRMQQGGCHPTDSNTCKGNIVGTPVPFEGAQFQFLAANVQDLNSKKTLLPPYAIKTFGDVRVAFIGMTLKETPTMVAAQGIKGLEFADEAATVNALIPELQAQGVRAVVVLFHQGGTQTIAQAADTINSCDGNLADSPIASIVNQLNDEVDLVISGHTHQAYNCQLQNKSGRLISITSANSNGRILTDIDIAVDVKTGDVARVSANNIIVDRTKTDVTPDAEIASIVDSYRKLAKPIADKVIGEIIADMPNTDVSAAGESAIGNLIADAQLQATAATDKGAAVIAFMNTGGIRSPGLLYKSSAASEGDGKVTYGEIFTLQPFANNLITLSLTGEQLHILLEQQFGDCHAGNAPADWNYPANDKSGQSTNRILQVSSGFSYSWSASGAACDKVDSASIKLQGAVINPRQSYRVTVNNYLANGGDKFYILAKATQPLGGALDVDVLDAYLKNPANDADPKTPGVQIAPGPQHRILRLE
ncbi:bifunctional metallophosphatase/5'-nucleotidase [Cellvibrio sp. NN19]|uniref:bifunctional metallophosphatase/5'-nucleotidase n=1 Tax=Cellvibrio chitinivorans TaxID=3102792 RepID=UPI002B4035E2|nr:bifunctional metallophosphatase/5'-nucleotidase [Cellvibrio sp. NN19]